MFNLFFGDVISIITTAFVLAMLAFIVFAIFRRGQISRWGRLILLFILVGTAISALSATRDGFATPSALFEMTEIQSVICAAAGAAIVLTGLITLFIRRQGFRKVAFTVISGFFIVQVLAVEVSRIALS